MNDLELATACARAGAAIVLRHFGRHHSAEFKGTNDPVTEVDRESEAAIVDLIRRHRAGDTIVAEEGTGSEGGARRWLIDPLDGTVNFLHNIPHVAVSVAVYDADTPLAAAITDVITGEIFTAEAGLGAWRNGSPIATTEATDLRETVMATGFFYDHDRFAAEYTRPVTAVLERVNGVRRFGSAALDMAWTASGRFDGYWGLGVAPWDIGAGILLIREAGGLVTDPFGEAATPDTRLIVSGGRGIHEPLRALVEANLPDRFGKER